MLEATFSEDGTSVLTASGDSTAKLWSTESGSCMQTFTGHGGCVRTATFSGDGTSVLTASHDNTAKAAEVRLSFAGDPC